MAASQDAESRESYGISEEIELLKAIYVHELEVQELGERQSLVNLFLHPSTGDDAHDTKYVCLNLVLTISEQYPYLSPEISINNPRGLSDAHITSIQDNLVSLAKEKSGTPMLYDLIEYAKDCLSDNNIPNCPCVICLEHFESHGKFVKTECYHYFHAACLANYVDHILTENKKKTIVCPMCRLEIAYNKNENVPEIKNSSCTDEVFVYKPDKEQLKAQAERQKIFEYQKQKGGIINLEQERNKYLIGIKDSKVNKNESNNVQPIEVPVPVKMPPKNDESCNEVHVNRCSHKNKVRASSSSRSRENMKSDKSYSNVDSFGEGEGEGKTEDALPRQKSGDNQRGINTTGRGNRRINKRQVKYTERTGRSVMPRAEKNVKSWRENERNGKENNEQVEHFSRQDKIREKQEKDTNFKFQMEDGNCQKKGEFFPKDRVNKANMEFECGQPKLSVADESATNSSNSFSLRSESLKLHNNQGENEQRNQHPTQRRPPRFEGENVQSRSQKGQRRPIVDAGNMCNQYGEKHKERIQSQQGYSRGGTSFASKRPLRKGRNFEVSGEKKLQESYGFGTLSENAKGTDETTDVSNETRKHFKAKNGKGLRRNNTPDTKTDNRSVVNGFPRVKADRISSSVVKNNDKTMRGTTRKYPTGSASPVYEKLAGKFPDCEKKAREASREDAQTTHCNSGVTTSTTPKCRVPPGYEHVTSSVKKSHSNDIV